MTRFTAEGDMKVESGHRAKVRRAMVWMIATLLCSFSLYAQYSLHIEAADADSAVLQPLQLQRNFSSRLACAEYVNKLPGLLQSRGLVSASIDSVRIDSTSAYLLLFVGEPLFWGEIRIDGLTEQEWERTNIRLPAIGKQPFLGEQLTALEKQLLNWMADNGYPFATVELDSVNWLAGQLNGILSINKGLNYLMDSIHVEGAAKISSRFLHRYLDIPAGSPYSLKQFGSISNRLRELSYLTESKPWDMRFGGNGAILNLYLEPKKSSQVNVLLGLLPGTDLLTGKTKYLVTGEALLNLQNALGAGETISVNWQQLQTKSPRLNLLYQQPYIFGSAFGIATQFDIFKKDSSFLNINGLIGLQYAVSARKTGKVFLQLLRTNLINVDTNAIVAAKALPVEMDMSTFNLGVDYDLFTTNYRRNPRRGWELYAAATAGIRNIQKNALVLEIKNPDFNFPALYDTVQLRSYQFRLRSNVARYFPIGRQAALQVKINGGWVQSQQLYRNELFQIGGYKTLRGFNEESIYASRYLINTIEYRYLVNMNSYFFGFADIGFTGNNSSIGHGNNRFIGLGLGMAFETTAGFFNLSLAAGKRDANSFDLKQTKIHLGYVNYF